MASYSIERIGDDTVLRNKYGMYSKSELEGHLRDGHLTVAGLGRVYGLDPGRMLHVLRSLGVSARTPLDESRVSGAMLTPAMRQVLLGTLLGDGYMRTHNSYGVAHGIHQGDYLYHVAESLGPFVSVVEYKKSSKGESLGLRTRCHHQFKEYSSRFYPCGSSRKVLGGVSIGDLGPEGLAYWFMDDGKYDGSGFYLCVGDLPGPHAEVLARMLGDRFGLVCTVQAHDASRGYRNIYVTAQSRMRFLELVSSSVIPSMCYKLNGTPYPRSFVKESVASRHVDFCAVVGRSVRFSGDDAIEGEIKDLGHIPDPREEYIVSARAEVESGRTVSRSSMRRLPPPSVLRRMFGTGMTDAEVARGHGVGRNRMAAARRALGIPRKASRRMESRIKFPCMDVRMVPSSKVVANSYNPNSVASPEMDLLAHSIEEDGVTQPIVTYYDRESDRYIVIDGFHRYRVLVEWFKCPEIPVVVLDKPLRERMASTIRHNRARGRHRVDLMGPLTKSLYEQGWADEEVAKHLGMSAEELVRLKQSVGIAKFIKAQEYSRSWVVGDD